MDRPYNAMMGHGTGYADSAAVPQAIPSGDLPHLIEQAASIAKNAEAIETDMMHLIARLYGEGQPSEPERPPAPIPVGAFHELKARMNAIEYHLDFLHQRVERLRNLA